MLPLAFAVLLETRWAALDQGMRTRAQSSPRPRECRAAGGGNDGLWLRLRDADAQRYCDFLARGYARLREDPAEALAAADRAQALAGTVLAPRLLRARALLRSNQPLVAYREFVAVELGDSRSFADPNALHDYARAASSAEQPVEAARLYRLLMSRLALMDDPRERLLSQIEAAAHVMATRPGGPDEALGYLAETRQQTLGLAAWVSGLSALALQRAGRAAPQDPRAAAGLGVQTGRAIADDLPLLPPGIIDAMRAALTRAVSPGPATTRENPR